MSTKTNSSLPAEPGGWSSSSIARLATTMRGRPFATAALIIAVIIQVFSANNDYSRIRTTMFDFYHRLNPRSVTELPVIIVDIDEQSLRQFGQWPWPRTLLAQLIEKTHAQGALAIGLDMILAEPDRSSPNAFAAAYPDLPENLKTELGKLPSNDDILADTLQRTGVIVGRAAMDNPTPDRANVSMTPSQVNGDVGSYLTPFPGHLTNIPVLSKAAAGFGYVNAIRDPDGVVRHMPVIMAVDNKIAPSMGLELIRVALGANWFTVNVGPDGVQSVAVGNDVLDTDANGQIALHFSPANPDRRISAVDVLNNQVPAPGFNNQIALIGVTGLGLADVATTPVSARMDGVEVQAQFIENLRYRTRLKRSKAVQWSEGAALVLSGLALIILLPWTGPMLGAGALVVLFAA
ncbi:MAG: CHASE2 domain-containing protein, partial [Alphaproteobacteria bacterium]|nr:CHASE2 domain-containing protein [Alphaproteobacteria bacterium]